MMITKNIMSICVSAGHQILLISYSVGEDLIFSDVND